MSANELCVKHGETLARHDERLSTVERESLEHEARIRSIELKTVMVPGISAATGGGVAVALIQLLQHIL